MNYTRDIPVQNSGMSGYGFLYRTQERRVSGGRVIPIRLTKVKYFCRVWVSGMSSGAQPWPQSSQDFLTDYSMHTQCPHTSSRHKTKKFHKARNNMLHSGIVGAYATRRDRFGVSFLPFLFESRMVLCVFVSHPRRGCLLRLLFFPLIWSNTYYIKHCDRCISQ